MIKTCEIANCEKIVGRRKGVCEMHYYRMRRNKDYYQRKLTTRPIEFEIDGNKCFIVTSHTPLSTGYLLTGKNGVRKSMHRLVYEECFGEIPLGLVVRHKCDVKNCINPEHLELGTQSDNVMDTVKRNRTLKGAENPQSKLSEEMVRQIKAMIAEGKRNCEIVKAMNVNKSTLCNIKRGVAWKHIS